MNEYVSEPVEYDLPLDNLDYKPCRKVLSKITLNQLANRIILPAIRVNNKLSKEEAIFEILSSDAVRSGPLEYLQNYKQELLEKIKQYTECNSPLQLLLMEIPFKVCNGLKVITHNLPDLAEVNSLLWLASIARAIKSIYPPGAKWTIIAEGRIIAEALYYNPDDAEKYVEAHEELLRVLKLKDIIKIVSLDELYKTIGANYREIMRDIPANDTAIAKILPQMRASLLLEDLNSEKKAMQMAVNYYAFLKVRDEVHLIERCYPNHIRCTLSPKPNRVNVKIGSEIWPHHGVGVLNKDNTVTVKYEIDVLRSGNYKAVYIEGYNYPFYYQRVGSSDWESIRLK